MNNDWRARILDPKERGIFEALSDPAWDFRTIAGLTKSTGLTEAEVRAIVEKYPELIRKSLVPARDGSELFKLRSRGVGVQERLAEARMFITKTVR